MGKEGKEQKPKKVKNGFRTFMRFLQHVSLAVMVLSVFVVVIGSTVRIQGFRSGGNYMLDSSDQNKEYEDSDLFDTIFGYAVADIIRYGVVSSQLETDGEFDGSKIVDVTAYNYRDIGLPEQYVTAEYHLEDLLKWANYGFEYTTMDMTEQQAGQFLSNLTRVTIIDPQSKYYNTSDANYLKSDIGSYTFVNDVSANQLWVENYNDSDLQEYDGFVEGYLSVGDDGSTEEITLTETKDIFDDSDNMVSSRDILVNRYKTAEEKNLEEYVSDWDLYYTLCENVENAAKSLSYNYSEYLEYGDYYSKENSNVRYLIAKTVGENTQYYSNLDGDEEENILELMQEEDGIPTLYASDKYIYYSPAEMIYRTNTSIEETTIRKILQGYDYAYPETVKIWIGVDTDYPVSDAFTQGAAGFRNYLPYFWQWIIVAVAAGILYLCLFVYQIIFTGRDVDANGEACIRLNAFDRIPTEAAAVIAFGAAVLAVWILIVVLELADIHVSSLSYGEAVYEQWFKILLVAGTFAADVVVMFFFYSLVRRVKAKTLWKNSYLRRLCCKLKEFAWKVYDNGNIVIRTWIPYGIFLLFNILMFIWAMDDYYIPWIPMIIVILVDIAVGILIYRDAKERQGIVEGIETIASGELEHQVETTNLHGDNLTLANSVNSIGKGIKEAVEISMKDERMKADLITNVSHDIKTPLTSIINYVDLIKRERVENEKVQSYIKVLDEKSQRLKQLTDDLVEASKISSGNISLNFERINVTELMNQTIGEFSEKFEQKNLTTVMNVNVQNSVIEADSRRIWRVMENLFNNIYKYAMEGTRVYVTIDSLRDNDGSIEISIKNISASALNCNPDELTERFIRGDVSRTTEGSGLGLSIAKNLTEVQKGTFEIRLDGDLFKVYLTFPLAK